MIAGRVKTSRIHYRARRGAAVVEFALVAPLLVLCVMGSIDVGQCVNVSQVVNDASRVGARLASRNTVSSASDVKSSVLSYLSNELGISTPTATVNVLDSSGTTIAGGDLTTISSGSSFSVQVIFSYDQVRWMAGFPGINGRTLETTTMMRRE